MKSLFITVLLVAMTYMLTGCANSQVRTPPWTEEEVKQMQEEDIKTVPIAIIRF